MKISEAKQSIGRIVAWANMDARIDPIKVILEEVGKSGMAKVSYFVEYKLERFITHKPVAELTAVV